MQKIIKLSDTHYIICDDSEIKEGDYMVLNYDHPSGKVRKCHYIVNNGHEDQLMIDAKDDFGWGFCKRDQVFKITHSTEPFEEGCKKCNGFCEQCIELTNSIELSEIEELVNGYSVEKMGESRFGIEREEVPHWRSYIDNDTLSKIKGYVKGFEAHQELVKDKLFTEEDMKKAYRKGFLFGDSDNTYYFDNLIESLKPKTEWNIIIDENKKISLL